MSPTPWLQQVGQFLELHVEQGRGLIDLDAPVGVASGIWPHGRWRFDVTGRADHAGRPGWRTAPTRCSPSR